jgi:hypothetical protein
VSDLTPFVKAFRALASAFEHQADNCRPREDENLSPEERQRDLGATIVLARSANAFGAAATDLKRKIASEGKS